MTQPAKFIETTIYGSKYRIDATLKGVNGVVLEVTTIWMLTNQQAKFVTLGFNIPNVTVEVSESQIIYSKNFFKPARARA